jgi:hypothetical protein
MTSTIPLITVPKIAKAETACSQTNLTQNERYTCRYNKGYVDAHRDWNSQLWTPSSGGDNTCPHAKQDTFEYCNGYQVGYTASWHNLIKQSSQIPSSNRPASNSPQSPASDTNTTASSPPASNTNSTTKPLTTSNPTSISLPTTDSWVWVVPLVIIAAIAWKLNHRKGKYRERQHFPDSVKEKVLEKQRHRCADCNRVLNVVDWHHKNRDRSDNRESNCVALCPNCHADRTRRHQ